MTHDLEQLPSLNPRIRQIIDEFNGLSKPGTPVKAVLLAIARRHRMTIYEIKKLLEIELGIEIKMKSYKKMINKQDAVQPDKITYATHIKNEKDFL